MNLNHLKYFYTVAREKGVTPAAKVLHVAQPSITKLVKTLEADVGQALFERVGRQLRLTKAGGDLYRHCEIIFGEVEKIGALFNARAEVGGPLNVGASDAVAAFLLPGAIRDLLAKHPAVIPAVSSNAAENLLDGLVAGRIETLFLLHTPRFSREVEIRESIPVPHSIVISAKHFNSKSTRSSFIGSREVDDKSTHEFPTLRLLQKENPEIRIRISTNSFTAHKDMVRQGLGVSVMPTFAVEKELKAGVLKCLRPKEKLNWPIRVMGLKGKPQSEAVKALISSMKSVLRS